MKRPSLRLVMVSIVSLLPALIGLGAALFVNNSAQAGSLLHTDLTFDVAGLASRLGIFFSLLFFAALVVWLAVRRWGSRRAEVAKKSAQTGYDAERLNFLQRLDHELKNPLAIIHLGLVNLRAEDTFSPEQIASLERMEAQTARLEKLVMDLRRLVELETIVPEQSPLDLSEVITDVVETSRPLYQGKTIDLSLQEVPWRVGAISGDRDLLTIAFHNLIDNAAKFTGEDGHVEVRLTDDGNVVNLEVADNGIGIPEDEIEQVDKELYRGRNAKRVAGSGLGLTLVQRILELHHFSMTVRSREGQGTIVQIRMSLAAHSGTGL